MMPTKSLLNFGVFMILVIRPRVRAVTLKYEEPFPPRFPLQVKSRVAFTQYGNVPMLSLEEIKNGFPWLKMSPDSEQSESRPRYTFYYLPTDSSLPSEARSDFRHYSGEESDHRFQTEANRASIPTRESTRRFKPIFKMKNENFDTGPVVVMGKYLSYATESKAGLHPLTLPRNHKFTDQDSPVGSQYLNVAETRVVPSYSYPRIPSPYMQPPRLKFEEKEFWVKNKWKSKRPVQNTQVGNAARLNNHRNVKQTKSKIVKPENEKRLRNHRPKYDREHDPEEGAESSDAKVEKPPGRTRASRPPRPIKEKTTQNPLLLSPDGERVQFQIHGHEGPQTYIFGFDTGSGTNRHFRLEERLRDGSVKGHYGYYDPYGKLKMVEYKTAPMEGYEEKHHASGAQPETPPAEEVSGDEAKS